MTNSSIKTSRNLNMSDESSLNPTVHEYDNMWKFL